MQVSWNDKQLEEMSYTYCYLREKCCTVWCKVFLLQLVKAEIDVNEAQERKNCSTVIYWMFTWWVVSYACYCWVIETVGDVLFLHQVRGGTLLSRLVTSTEAGRLPPQLPQPSPVRITDLPNPSRSHMCPFCMKNFYGSVDLERHKRTHTGEKPFACTHCLYRATQLGNLQRHMKTKHQVYPPNKVDHWIFSNLKVISKLLALCK